MSVATISSSEFRANMPKVVQTMKKSNQPVTVFRNSKPWFEIRPLSVGSDASDFKQALKEVEEGKLNSYDTPQDLFESLGI